jgi:hypothetical protein
MQDDMFTSGEHGLLCCLASEQKTAAGRAAAAA